MQSAVREKTRAQAEREVRDLGWWYQDFELPNGVRTGTGKEPSYRPEGRWGLIESHIPEDLSGRSVRDVGGRLEDQPTRIGQNPLDVYSHVGNVVPPVLGVFFKTAFE